ncbi:MAG: bifunctional phosphoribosylaminoimidazolecarboxamide formyltransferase/IMP cyclohydrolase [Planctomycetota bacterium]
MAQSDPQLIPVKRALLSVSDKTGLVDFARVLSDEFGVELLSTGGTAKALREAGLPVTDVSDVTGFPEIMAGRVKTLHPTIHGGLLGRLPEDRPVMAEHGIEPIDLVCINLYPFEETVAKPDVTYAQAIENIDIGGPAMIRAAAKNHERVLVVTDHDRYPMIIAELREQGGATTFAFRRQAACSAFAETTEYDAAIFNYLGSQVHPGLYDPARREPKAVDLRYGENPHQKAQLQPGDLRNNAPREASVAFAEQLHGKQLGYINLLDADAALNGVREWQEPACCIVKHATPCGVGLATSRDREGAGGQGGSANAVSVPDDAPAAEAFGPLPDGRGSWRASLAFENAYAGDPLAAFGGVLAMNVPVDCETAEAMVDGQKFLEVVVAPSFEDDALKLLRDRWKNVRLLAVGPMTKPGRWSDDRMVHHLVGGIVEQDRDLVGVVEAEWKVVSERQPSDNELEAMKFNWLCCKHVKSNAVVIGGTHGTFGIGGGQVDRVAAAEQAVKKAGDRGKDAVAASDAFFPFPDGPEALLDAGVTAIVQPGGSRNDQLTIDLVNERGATMIFTGRRHFRH